METVHDEIEFLGPSTFFVLPRVFISRLTFTTPDVSNVSVYESHQASTTVTNFLNGAEGQTIRILGNGNTTISHNANIKTNTGANKVLAADKMYVFTLINGVWYEDN